jgi:hypothetical protein
VTFLNQEAVHMPWVVSVLRWRRELNLLEVSSWVPELFPEDYKVVGCAKEYG